MGRRGRFRANVLRLGDVDPSGDFLSSDPGFHDHLILAEGDSWFSIGGFPPSNMLYGLRFRKHTMVVSCAEPGDTILNMAQLVSNEHWQEALSPGGYDWDLILMSGGGNDLIDAAESLLLNRDARSLPPSPQSEDYVDEQAVSDLLADINTSYRTLVSQRDAANSPAQGKPIVTHTYDYITPRNEPVRFFGSTLSGPWLYKAFDSKEIPRDDWIGLSKYLLDRLADTILSLQTGPDAIDNFHVVDTRGTLTAPKLNEVGPTTHWLNEIHPNHDGYKELGRKIERERLYQLLYGGF